MSDDVKLLDADRPCGHEFQTVDEIRVVTGADGIDYHERIPQRMRVRGSDSRYCFGCNQVVDKFDDAQAVKSKPCRALGGS